MSNWIIWKKVIVEKYFAEYNWIIVDFSPWDFWTSEKYVVLNKKTWKMESCFLSDLTIL